MTTIRDLCNELSYRSYRAQRLQCPARQPQDWRVIFPQWRIHEARFQLESACEQVGGPHEFSFDEPLTVTVIVA